MLGWGCADRCREEREVETELNLESWMLFWVDF